MAGTGLVPCIIPLLPDFDPQVIFKSCNWFQGTVSHMPRGPLSVVANCLGNSTVIGQPEAVFCTELIFALNCNCPGFEGQGRNEGRGGGRD